VFSIFKRKRKFFTDEETHRIHEAVQQAEKHTSGEIRVYVESRCSWMDALDRAAEIFFSLKMDQTKDRNAVLIYVAIKDRQVAVFADEGIHKKAGSDYWNKVVSQMLSSFAHDLYAKAIYDCVLQVGFALHDHFPYDKDTDKNELPDDIVLGR